MMTETRYKDYVLTRKAQRDWGEKDVKFEYLIQMVEGQALVTPSVLYAKKYTLEQVEAGDVDVLEGFKIRRVSDVQRRKQYRRYL